jgi:paraquat-inducible protein A
MSSWQNCPACRQVVPVWWNKLECPHCANPLPQRRPGSGARSAAFALAAAIMLVPAYTLPVMSIEKLGRAHADTIFNGVWKLWHQGMWGLAIIVFTASLLVPVPIAKSTTPTEVSPGWIPCVPPREDGRTA